MKIKHASDIHLNVFEKEYFQFHLKKLMPLLTHWNKFLQLESIQLVVFNSWKCTIMQNASHVFSKFHFTNEDFNWFFPHGYPNTRLMSWYIVWHNSRQRSYIVTNSLSLSYIVTNPLSFLWQEGSTTMLKTTMWECFLTMQLSNLYCEHAFSVSQHSH